MITTLSPDTIARVETLAAAADEQAKSLSLEALIERINNLPRATEEDATRWDWENDTIPRLKAAGFVSRFWNDRRGEMHPKQRVAYEAVKAKLTQCGAIIALTGERGCGKTTICAALAMCRAQDVMLKPWDRQPPYRKMTDLVAYYKPLYADFGSTQIDSLMSARESLCGHALLFIDEVHECDDQKMKDRILTDILDRRYAAEKDTVLISNQTAADFQKTSNDSVRSRISEHGMIVPCKWESFR